MRPECEEHYTPARDNRYRATARYYVDSCPYCEIDRLKAELEEAQADLKGVMHDYQEVSAERLPLWDEIEDLERQLAEARAEVDRYKTGVEVEGLFDVQYGLNLCSSETHKLDNSVRYGKVRVLIMKLEG